MKLGKLLLGLTAAALVLAGCSGGGKGAAVDIVPAEAAKTLVEAVAFQDTLMEAEGETAKLYYQLDDTISDFAVYISGSGGTAEEVAVLKVKDSKDLASAEAIAKKRVEELVFRFEDYVPAELTKLQSPVIVARDNVVVLVIAADTAAAEKAVNGLFA